MSAKGYKMFRDYLKYKEGCDILQTEVGFIIYKVNEDHIHMNNIWVDPVARRSGEGISLMGKIYDLAKQKGLKYITGAVDLNQENATQSMQAVASQMTILKDNYVVQFYKEVE